SWEVAGEHLEPAEEVGGPCLFEQQAEIVEQLLRAIAERPRLVEAALHRGDSGEGCAGPRFDLPVASVELYETLDAASHCWSGPRAEEGGPGQPRRRLRLLPVVAGSYGVRDRTLPVLLCGPGSPGRQVVEPREVPGAREAGVVAHLLELGDRLL